MMLGLGAGDPQVSTWRGSRVGFERVSWFGLLADLPVGWLGWLDARGFF